MSGRISAITKFFSLNFEPVFFDIPLTTVSPLLISGHIPLRVVVPAPRYFHTSRPSSLPLVGFQPQTVKVPKRVEKNRVKKPGQKRHWKDRIGTVFSRARGRLADEDPDWRLRLSPNHKRDWANYLEKVTQEGIDEEQLWKKEKWIQRDRKIVPVRPKEHEELIKLWKQGFKSKEDLERKSGELKGPQTRKEFSEQLKVQREQVIYSKAHQTAEDLPVQRPAKAQERLIPLPDKEQQPAKAEANVNSYANRQTIELFLQRLREQKMTEGIGTGTVGHATMVRNENSIKTDNRNAGSQTTQPLQPTTIDSLLDAFQNPTLSHSESTITQGKPLQESIPRPITLGLEKITALLSKLDNPQNSLKVVHVAGTNGKGSVCAYVTSSLIASGLKVGQFISPHLIQRWDGITLNNTSIPESKFQEIERIVKETSINNDIGASTFEILTACALTYFVQEKVDVAVIEAGMGGLLDATNVFISPLVSIITPISLDHTAYLGDTVAAIARHKAGIIKAGSPVVIGPQPPHVHSVIAEQANEVDAPLYVALGYWRSPSQTRYLVENVRFTDTDPSSTPILGVVPGISGSEQSVNVACAVKALSLLRTTFRGITEEAVQKGVASASIPGRMEWVRFELPEGRVPILLDGAHNPASCAALGEFVGNLRRNAPVIWIIAFSKGRDILSCMRKFVKEGDSVACVEFGPVDGMDWVEPADEEDIAQQARILTGKPEGVKKFGHNLPEAIRWAITETKERRGMLVGTGSLYLVGDIHRLRRDDPQFE